VGKTTGDEPVANARRGAFTVVELLIAVAIVALLAGITLPAIAAARAASAVAACKNNLKQIALACLGFEADRGRLPPGHRAWNDDDRLPFSGWPLSILPYLDLSQLHSAAVKAYAEVPFPAFNPPHTPLSTVVVAFACRSDSRMMSAHIGGDSALIVALTSYLGVSGTSSQAKDGLLYGGSTTRMTDISDGTSCTLMLGERPPSTDYRLGWWYAGFGIDGAGGCEMHLGVRETNSSGLYPSCPVGPYHFVPERFGNRCGHFHFWSPHNGGANFALADGSVHFLGYSADSRLVALATRAAGDSGELP
jgi:prepilin-type processing-associated H-X9-DG protein/prepilin-type N-terminal cleavage/methylation domain-containing protein